MILQVLADPPQVHDRLDSEVPQLRGVADTGQHKKFRAMDRAGREDHFAGCADIPGAIGGNDFHPARAISVEGHFCDVGIQQKRKIRTVEVWPQEGAGRAHAGTISGDIHVDIAGPGAHWTVHVVDDGKTHLTSSLYKGWGRRVGIARLANVDWSARTAPLVSAAF